MGFRNVSVSPALAAARASSRESYLTLVVSLTTTGSAGVGVGASLVGSAEPSPSSRVLRLPLLPPSRYASSPPNWTPSFTAVGAELELFPPNSSAYALPPNRLMHIATRRRMDKNLVTFFMFSVSLYCCFYSHQFTLPLAGYFTIFPPGHRCSYNVTRCYVKCKSFFNEFANYFFLIVTILNSRSVNLPCYVKQ